MQDLSWLGRKGTFIKMSVLDAGHRNLAELVRLVQQLASYVVVFVRVFPSPRAKTTATVVASRSQLAICIDRVQQEKKPKPRFTPAFRLLWVVLSRFLDRWEDLAQPMEPATVKRWHRAGFRPYWRWKSRKRGRPSLDEEMQAPVRKLSRENPLWTAERIRDTLLFLGYPLVSNDTGRKYMVKRRKPREPSTTWLPFLMDHPDVTWAISFLAVPTISFATVYLFLVFEHGRRRVIHLATTRNPSLEWVIQQLRNAMPFGSQPRYLLPDNDGVHGHGVALSLRSCGICEVRTALQSPWQSPYVERSIGTLRRALLNHVIVLNEHHLERLGGGSWTSTTTSLDRIEL